MEEVVTLEKVAGKRRESPAVKPIDSITVVMDALLENPVRNRSLWRKSI